MASKKQRDKAKQRRLQLEVDPELKNRLKELSDELGVPQSQIIALFAEYGFEGLESGDLDLKDYLEPAKSPIWRFNLNLDKFRRRKKRK